jgi:hypothetical protein
MAVVGAVAAVAFAPEVGVFAVIVALNALLGGAEAVPFSRYPMFSEPSERSWALRFEGPAGDPVPLGAFGILPPTARKRFGLEQRVGENWGMSTTEARAHAAGVLGDWLNEHRPRTGPLEQVPISIVLIEYAFDGEAVVSRRELLTVVPPSPA